MFLEGKPQTICIAAFVTTRTAPNLFDKRPVLKVDVTVTPYHPLLLQVDVAEGKLNGFFQAHGLLISTSPASANGSPCTPSYIFIYIYIYICISISKRG